MGRFVRFSGLRAGGFGERDGHGEANDAEYVRCTHGVYVKDHDQRSLSTCIIKPLRKSEETINRVNCKLNGQQETQLSLTNRATRLDVNQVTKHGTILYVRYGFLLVCYINFVRDTRLQKCRDLENRVRSPWRSLKMPPFDWEPMNSYWCSIVWLSRVVSKIFNVEKISRPWNPGQGSVKVIESGTIR